MTAILANTTLTIQNSTAFATADPNNVVLQRDAVPTGSSTSTIGSLLAKGYSYSGTLFTTSEIRHLNQSLGSGFNNAYYGSMRRYANGQNSSATNLGWIEYLTTSGYETVRQSNGSTYFSVTSTAVAPTGVDNAVTLGASTARWTIVYATTGTINTSDFNFKEQIADLDAAELRVATAIKGMIKKFKWKDAVEAKGDAARIHVGVIAQEVEAAFVAEGLDPERYALFCKDVWWEKTVPNEKYELYWERQEQNPKWMEGSNEPQEILVRYDSEVENAQKIERCGSPEKLEKFTEEVEGGVRKERKGIRYDQLLAFIIAAM